MSKTRYFGDGPDGDDLLRPDPQNVNPGQRLVDEINAQAPVGKVLNGVLVAALIARGNDVMTEEVVTCNSPKFGTGEVYHCGELDCPVHGDRNKRMMRVAETATKVTKEEAFEGLAELMRLDDRTIESLQHIGPCVPVLGRKLCPPRREPDMAKVLRHSEMHGTLEPEDPTFVRNSVDTHDNRCWCEDCAAFRASDTLPKHVCTCPPGFVTADCPLHGEAELSRE